MMESHSSFFILGGWGVIRMGCHTSHIPPEGTRKPDSLLHCASSQLVTHSAATEWSSGNPTLECEVTKGVTLHAPEDAR